MAVIVGGIAHAPKGTTDVDLDPTNGIACGEDHVTIAWGRDYDEPPFGAEAIAHVIGFLLSPASAPVHGSVLFADGGTDALLRPDHV